VSPEARQALLMTAGALHFLQIPSMRYLSRGGLRLSEELARLSPINQRIVRLFVAAVMLLLLGLGASAALHSRCWVTTPLGHFLTALLGVFWLGRALSQAWLFDAWPRGAGNRSLYFALFALYAFLAGSYLLVAGAALLGESAAQRTPLDT
jgi:hypothetical protein